MDVLNAKMVMSSTCNKTVLKLSKIPTRTIVRLTGMSTVKVSGTNTGSRAAIKYVQNAIKDTISIPHQTVSSYHQTAFRPTKMVSAKSVIRTTS